MSSSSRRIRHEHELPDHVVEEIITRLPAKHVFRCKFLSKTYYDLIENPRFINKHLRYHSASSTHSNIIHTFSYYSGRARMIHGMAYLPISQSDSDAHAELYVPLPANRYFNLLGSCNGLLCASFFTQFVQQIVIWNPATREHRILPRPPLFRFSGFGYDAKTGDYKLVLFSVSINHWCPSDAVIWSMRSNCWKEVMIWKPVLSRGTDTNSRSTSGTFIKGKIYWLVLSNKCELATQCPETTVLAFDVADDSFDKIIALPDDAPSWVEPGVESILLDFMGSLALLTNLMPSSYFEFGIWVLKKDDENSKNYEWAKHFTIGQFPFEVLPTRMTSTNGMLLLEQLQYSTDIGNYFWYDPQSKEQRDIPSSPLLPDKVPFWTFTGSLVSLKQTTIE